MPAIGGARDSLAHEARADAAAAMGSGDRERAEQQRFDAAGAHRPEPHRADERVAVLGDEREAVGGQTSGAQTLARLLEAQRAKGGLEQGLARGRVLGPLAADRGIADKGNGRVDRGEVERQSHRSLQKEPQDHPGALRRGAPKTGRGEMKRVGSGEARGQIT